MADAADLKSVDSNIVPVRVRNPAPILGSKIMKEFCICAAIKTIGGKVIYGHRHDDCIQTAMKLGCKNLHGATQGFVTSHGRFVGREEAMIIQQNSGVPSTAIGGYRGDVLFSEDLY